MFQLVGRGNLATSMDDVLPSVSIKTGSGNREAKVDFPIPSGPYTTTFFAFLILPLVIFTKIHLLSMLAAEQDLHLVPALSHIRLQ